MARDLYGLNLTWTASPNADYYDIFRRTNGGALTWTGRSLTTAFSDATVPPGASISYVVRARNDNMFLDSAQTAAFLYEIFRITAVTRTGAGGQNVTLNFISIAGVAYRVQKSANLAAGSWTDAGVTAAGNGDVQSVTVPSAGLSGRYYFRVVGE